jgi:hypothetical protein
VKTPTLLIAALCSLALFFGWKAREAWIAPPPAVDNTGRISPGSRQPGAPVPDPAPPPPAESAAVVAAVAARPLFRQDRQPFREDAAGVGRNYDAELSRLSMIGVLTFGDEMKGVVVTKGSPRPERWEVKKGDMLPGFKVKEVQNDGLVVTADGREFLLPLYAGAPAAGAVPLRTEITKSAPSPSVQSPTAPPRPGQEIRPKNTGAGR